MIHVMIASAAIFCAGVVLGAELNRRSRANKPLVGSFKKTIKPSPTVKERAGSRRL